MVETQPAVSAQSQSEPRLMFDNKMSLVRFMWLHFIISRRLSVGSPGETQVTLADGHYWRFIKREGVHCKVARPGVGVRTVYTVDINKVWIASIDGKS